MEEVAFAWENKVFKKSRDGKKYFSGKSTNGIEIEFLIDDLTNKLNTAYPKQ